MAYCERSLGKSLAPNGQPTTYGGADSSAYNNYWKIHKESTQAPTKFNQAQSAIQRALKDTGAPSSWVTPMLELSGRESTWSPTDQNNTSTAYGLFQFLNGTWKDTGISKTSDPYKQSIAAIKYIKERYGDPVKALQFWDQNKWY